MSKIIADIMVPAPIVVEVPGSRSDAINIMVRNKLTGLPVVRASDGKLMGIVSRRDIFRKFDEDQLSLIMKKGCITITPDATVEEAARIFSTHRIHRLPVVEDGKLVGIVTPTDLLAIVKDMKTPLLAEDVEVGPFRVGEGERRQPRVERPVRPVPVVRARGMRQRVVGHLRPVRGQRRGIPCLGDASRRRERAAQRQTQDKTIRFPHHVTFLSARGPIRSAGSRSG